MTIAVPLRQWKTCAGVLLLVALGLGLLALKAERRRAERWEAKAAERQAAYERFEMRVRSAAEQARAQDAARAARIERDQIAVSQETMDAYRKELDVLRARHAALRVRAAAAGTDPDAGGSTAMSRVPGAAGGADGAAGEDRLPAEDALTASEQALRLKSLQDWVRGQTEVVR